MIQESILSELRAGILPVIQERVELKKKGREYFGLCPFHAESTPSFSVNADKQTYYCHGCQAGGDAIEFVQRLDGADFRTAAQMVASKIGVDLPDAEPIEKIQPQIVATFDFHDADGAFLYQKCRFEPGFNGQKKTFAFRRKDDQGRWIWGLNAGSYFLNGKGEWREAKTGEAPTRDFPEQKKIIYRLPEWKAADVADWHLLTEGEKHADLLRSWGYTATSFKDLKTSDWQLVKGRKLAWLPDNDEAGKKILMRLYPDLSKHAAQSLILELPRLSEKEDVIDWAQKRGGTKEELQSLIDAASGKGDAEAPQVKGCIDLYFTGDLAALSDAAWNAVQAVNDPPYLFQRDGQAFRLEQDGEELYLRGLNADKMRYEIARAAVWTRKGDATKPPKDVAVDMLAANPMPLPAINRIVRVPVYSASGKLSTAQGYDLNTTNYLAFAGNYGSLPVSETPSSEEVEQALSLILDDVLVDFPFVSNADQANALALMLLPFARDMINGPTPCHLIDSSANGSGKSLLAECLLFPSQHKFPGNVSEIGRNEEMEKTLFSLLLAREPVIFLDNINAKVSSGVLANYITAETKSGRLLGQSLTIQVPVKVTWVMTGANVELSNENTRRCIYIRLVPDSEAPESRTGFKHEFLKDWIIQNSARLAWAAHTLIQNWIAQGRPKPSAKPLGSFERWHHVIGGILQSAGVGSFLGNQDELMKNANVERTSWTEFVDHWWTNFRDDAQTAGDLLGIAEHFEGIEVQGNTDKARQISFSKQLAKQRDKYFTARRLTIVKAHRSSNGRYWKLRSDMS